MAETRSQKRQKLNDEDYISVLPDDVLLQILSKLNPLEAARTSLLSTRWIDLWTLNSTSLNIDASELIPDSRMFRDKIHSRINIDRFISTASQILTKHRTQTIDQLSITYPLCASHTLRDHQDLDAWINIAAKKQVKSLKLHFLPLTCNLIESFLSNSPNLEELSIIGARGNLNHLRISGSSLKLKRLELLDNDIESLELSAPKLESFKFKSWTHSGTAICFKDVPNLTQLSYSELLISKARCDYYSLLPQLETLTLTQLSCSPMAAVIPSFLSRTNLKQMHLSLDTNAAYCLFWGLFRASTFLSKLFLHLRPTTCSQVNLEFSGYCPDHKFLKEVKIDGFIGSDSEIQLLECIARSSPSLERIIIHPIPFRDGDLFMDPKHAVSVIDGLPSKLPRKEVKILLDASDLPAWMDLQDLKIDRYLKIDQRIPKHRKIED